MVFLRQMHLLFLISMWQLFELHSLNTAMIYLSSQLHTHWLLFLWGKSAQYPLHMKLGWLQSQYEHWRGAKSLTCWESSSSLVVQPIVWSL